MSCTRDEIRSKILAALAASPGGLALAELAQALRSRDGRRDGPPRTVLIDLELSSLVGAGTIERRTWTANRRRPPRALYRLTAPPAVLGPEPEPEPKPAAPARDAVPDPIVPAIAVATPEPVLEPRRPAPRRTVPAPPLVPRITAEGGATAVIPYGRTVLESRSCRTCLHCRKEIEGLPAWRDAAAYHPACLIEVKRAQALIGADQAPGWAFVGQNGGAA
jgi:hypothetical protein